MKCENCIQLETELEDNKKLVDQWVDNHRNKHVKWVYATMEIEELKAEKKKNLEALRSLLRKLAGITPWEIEHGYENGTRCDILSDFGELGKDSIDEAIEIIVDATKGIKE